MSGRKCSSAHYVDTAAILAAQEQQRAREAAERARLAQEVARQRAEQLQSAATSRCATIETRSRALLAVPLSRFVDGTAVRHALGTIDRIRAGLAGHGLTESQILQLTSNLEAQECRLNEMIAIANQFVARRRRQEHRMAELESEAAAFLKPLAGRFQSQVVAAHLRDQGVALRQRIAEAGTIEMATLESEIDSFRSHLRSENQRLTSVADEAGKYELRLQELRQRLQNASVEFSAYWADAEAKSCLRELESIQQLLVSAGELGEVQVTAVRLTQAEREFNEIVVAAKGRQRAEHLAFEERALEELVDRLQTIDPVMISRFGESENRALQRQFQEIRELLKSGNLEKGRKELAGCRNSAEGFLLRLQQAITHWEAALGKANQHFQQVLVQWTPARTDVELLERLPGRGDPVEAELQKIQAEIAAEHFESAVQKSMSLQTLLATEMATARRLIELERALNLILKELTTLHEVTGARFDFVGRSNVEAYLNAGEKAVAHLQAGNAAKFLGDAQRALQAHRESAMQQFEKYRTERDSAMAKLSTASDLIQGLLQDDVVCRWNRKEVESLSEKLDRARSALADGRCIEAEKTAQSIVKTASEIVESVKPLESQADLQRRMARSIEAALAELGFDCDSGAEDPMDPKSAIILQAERQVFGEDVPGRINVAVEPSGSLEYHVGGAFEKTNEYDARLRRPVSRCDEAEEKLLELHSILRGMGIKTTGITWDGKRPDNDTGEGLAIPEVDRQQFDDTAARTIRRGTEDGT